MDVRPGGRERWLIPAALAAVATLIALVLGYLTDLGPPHVDQAVIDLAYYGLMGAGVALVALRVRRRSDLRGAWTLMALGLLGLMAGDAYYAIYEPTAYPSLGDGFYVLSYIAFLGGMRAMGGKVRVAGFVSVSLLVAVLGMATVWSWLVFDGILSTPEGSTAAIATAASFPMFDLMLLASALVALSARGWHLNAAFASLIGGFVLLAAGDLIYTAQVAAGTSSADTVASALWPAGAIAVAFAAWLPASFSEAGVRGNRLVPALAAVAAAVATAALVADHFDPRGTVTVLLAGATLLAATAQVVLLFRGRERAAAETLAARALHGASTQAALDCVITIDQHGLVREWNDAAQRTFGYTRAEAVGREVAELIIPTGVGTILGKRIEVMARHARGGQFPVELAVTQVQAEPPDVHRLHEGHHGAPPTRRGERAPGRDRALFRGRHAVQGSERRGHRLERRGGEAVRLHRRRDDRDPRHRRADPAGTDRGRRHDHQRSGQGRIAGLPDPETDQVGRTARRLPALLSPPRS